MWREIRGNAAKKIFSRKHVSVFLEISGDIRNKFHYLTLRHFTSQCAVQYRIAIYFPLIITLHVCLEVSVTFVICNFVVSFQML